MARTFLTDIALPRDPTSPMHAVTKQYVDNQPAGTATDLGSVSGTVTPTVGISTIELRYTATAAVTFALPGGTTADGQVVQLWVYASGGDQVVTMASGYEVTQQVPGRVFTVPSGTWGQVEVANRNGVWVLVSAWPQVLAATVITKFTASGTYTVPTGVKAFRFTTIGAGGGSCSGNRSASGTACAGGGSGGAGGMSEQIIPASEFGSTITVNVGVGGTAGASVSTGTAGSPGGNGGSSSVVDAAGSSRCWSGGGRGGTATARGDGGLGQVSGGNGQAPTSGGAGTAPASDGWGPTGGGSGGGLAATPASLTGGAGSTSFDSYRAGGTAAVNAAGGAGAGGTTTAGGSGGAGGSSNATGAGYAGGAGGAYGGGAGGGGASLTSSPSGAGNVGGGGLVQIVALF